MIAGNCLTGRTHADSIAAENLCHPHFRRCFVIWSGKLDINALPQRNVIFCRCFLQQLPQISVIDLGHIRESCADCLRIAADQR